MLGLKEGTIITVEGHNLLVDKVDGALLVLRAAARFPTTSNALLRQLAEFKQFGDHDVLGISVHGMEPGTVAVSLSKKEPKSVFIEPSEQAVPVKEQAYV